MSAFDAAIAAQRRSADPGSSVFVTANAGSGKTKVLVDRIARLLLDGFAPSAFLCITYTKAAAAEMQRRLFERLGGWCVAKDVELASSLTDLRGEPPREGELARARTLFARALETPGGLRIQTIHAFCERLLGRFPLEAGIAPGFEIADDARSAAMLAAAWAHAASTRADSAAHFAERLDIERLEKLVALLAAHREKLSTRLPALTPERLRARHRAPSDRAAYVADALRSIDWRAMKDVADAMDDHATAAGLRAALALEGEARLMAFLDVFLTQDRTPRKQVYAAKHVQKASFVGPCLDRAKDEALDIHLNLKRIDRVADALAAAHLADALITGYETEKARRGLLDFDDLIVRSRRLLTDAQASAWVLYKLDGGVDHILIDEGQDTSPGQWDLIAPLQDEFFSGASARRAVRTVFAVGDPKQSIYSFQGADPARFLSESQALSARAAAAEQTFVAPDMTMSFRSTPEVLRAVDAVFGRDGVGAGAPGIFDRVRHQAFREREQGLVEWWPLAPPPELKDPIAWKAPLDMEPSRSAMADLAAAVAQRIATWIATGEAVWDVDAARKPILRPMRPGDVLILVRKRGPVFQQMLKAMKRAGLPVAGADRMVLREETAVEDMLALMRAMIDPADDLSLAVVLKSPLVGLIDDDADIFPLAHGRRDGETVADRLAAATDPKYAFAQTFIAHMRSLASGPPYEFLAAALERPDPDDRSGWARMAERLGVEARDPLEELLTRALAFAREGPATLQGFLAAIEQDDRPIKREMEQGGDVVRVMTVHGAKGLEAPVVILPDTCAGAEGKAESFFIDDLGPIFSPNKKGDDDVVEAARLAASQAAEAEHRRLLYVALTRARDRMIVCGHLPRNAKTVPADSWHTLVGDALQEMAEQVETPFGQGLRLGAPLMADARGQHTGAPGDLPAWARTPAPREGPPPRPTAPSKLGHSPARAMQTDGARRFTRGLLIHGLLQRLPDAPPARRVELARAWLAPQGATGETAEALIAEALGVLEHPDFAPVFGPGSRAEAPVVGKGPGLPPGGVRGSIDRLIVSRDEVLIIDFKTDRPPPEDPADVGSGYLTQLAAYRAVLAQAFPDRPVRCALIWTEAPRLMPIPEALLDAALPAYTPAPR